MADGLFWYVRDLPFLITAHITKHSVVIEKLK